MLIYLKDRSISCTPVHLSHSSQGQGLERVHGGLLPLLNVRHWKRHTWCGNGVLAQQQGLSTLTPSSELPCFPDSSWFPSWLFSFTVAGILIMGSDVWDRSSPLWCSGWRPRAAVRDLGEEVQGLHLCQLGVLLINKAGEGASMCPSGDPRFLESEGFPNLSVPSLLSPQHAILCPPSVVAFVLTWEIPWGLVSW